MVGLGHWHLAAALAGGRGDQRVATGGHCQCLRGGLCVGLVIATARTSSWRLVLGAALREAFPETREQRCWFHKSESTFATVRLRQRVTKGPGYRTAGIAMAFKLIESAQARWRAVNAPHLVALVRAGARFENGQLVERPDESGGDQQAA